MNDYLRLLGALTSGGVEFVVVGGTAAVLHGSATATYDLDVLMPFSRENCERLLDALSALYPRLAHTPDKRRLTLSADQLATFKNLYLATDLGRLDVLGSLPPLEDTDAVIARSVRMDVGGIEIRVVSLDDLIAVKSAMKRPKDQHVAVELRAIAAAKKSGA